MRAVILILAAALALGACTKKSERLFFDGKEYPSKAKNDKGVRESFSVSVRRADQGLEGAREAGRHAGVKYCIENYGTSQISWSQGPDVEDAALVVDNGSLVLRGTCVTW